MNIILKLTMIVLVFASGVIVAEKLSTTLVVEPNRCIALQQGQACFADLKFRWTSPATGDYCLFDERQSDPLLCWVGNSVTSHKLLFNSRENVVFEIRSESGGQAPVQALVKVSWVYKSNTSSTSRWRLF